MKAQNSNQKTFPSQILCVDFSGSMAASTELQGNKIFQNAVTDEELNMIKEFLEPGTTIEQYMQQLSVLQGNLSFVSRKQCVLLALETQLKQLLLKEPSKKIGLITFNSSVVIYGDGNEEKLVIEGDRLLKEEV